MKTLYVTLTRQERSGVGAQRLHGIMTKAPHLTRLLGSGAVD